MKKDIDRGETRIEAKDGNVPYLCVLVVDDEPAVRDFLAHSLGQRGFSVITASDLRSAAGAAGKRRPDVILLDVRLGAEDGLQLAHLLRDEGLAIPCVVLTGRAGPYDGFTARDLGVVDLLEKPVPPDEIAAALRQAASGISRVTRGSRSAQVSVESDTHQGGGVVESAKRFIEEHFRTKALSLQLIASSIQVTPAYLSARFRRDVGCSPIAYLHTCRLEYGAFLLSTTVLPVKIVADECGYHDSSEFIHHFRPKFGASPSEYRRIANTPNS